MILLTLLAVIGTLALCNQWERASLAEWRARREERRPAYQAWWARHHRRTMARYAKATARATRKAQARGLLR